MLFFRLKSKLAMLKESDHPLTDLGNYIVGWSLFFLYSINKKLVGRKISTRYEERLNNTCELCLINKECQFCNCDVPQMFFVKKCDYCVREQVK